LTRKSNYFEARLLFIRQWKMYVAQVRRKTTTAREGEMNKRKLSSFALCAVLFALCSSAEAQQQAKVAKIGWLGARPASAGGQETIRRMLRDLGYVEGKNIAFEYRYADNELDRLPALADELVRLKVDLLLTPSTPEALAAKKASMTIPIVFISVGDPIAAGLVDSLARPGGNITGFTNISAVLAGKRLELLKETVPKLSRLAVLWDSLSPSVTQVRKESQLAARELGLQLHFMEVSNANQYEVVFKEATKARSVALAVIQSPFMNSHQKLITDLATRHRLPAIYPRGDWIANGGLMSYGPDQAEPYRRVAVFVDKILKGTKPSEIPVEQPTKFEFIINLKAAKQIGLTIPPDVLARATKIIR
jgi:putative ABC transport system substrate-binding protein